MTDSKANIKRNWENSDPMMFRILISSDNHLGYLEKDPIRGDDSFNSFEEVLQIAKKEKVDMVLLGGDLFHDNRPSFHTTLRCTELLRKYCYGSDSIKFNIVSEQTDNFQHSKLFPLVNYEDENINVSMPIFTIHGNHDDPTGKQPVSALETMAAAGLINYFGKYVNMEKVDVSPLLLRKGSNQIALYGLGSLPEERLHRMFLQKKVNFLCPATDAERWFKIFVVHQNRPSRGKKYLPEKFLTDLPDLVVWGHEHECIPVALKSTQKDYYIYQPGSTVATSLCPAESKAKHVCILQYSFDEDTKHQFNIIPIPLRSVRQFYFEELLLDELMRTRNVNINQTDKILSLCVDKVEDILSTASLDHSGDSRQPMEPLIRLRVLYKSEINMFSPQRFNQHFIGRVANPKDIVLLKAIRGNKPITDDVDTDLDFLDELIDRGDGRRCDIVDIVNEYFQNCDEKSKLTLLSEEALSLAVKDMVDKGSGDAITEVIEFQIKNMNKYLKSLPTDRITDTEVITAHIKQHREDSLENDKSKLHGLIKKARASDDKKNKNDDDDTEEVTSDEDEKPKGRGKGKGATRARGRGRGAARGSKRESTSSARKGRAKSYVFEDSDEDDS